MRRRRLRRRLAALKNVFKSTFKARSSRRFVVVVGLLVVLALVTKAMFVALSTTVYTIF